MRRTVHYDVLVSSACGDGRLGRIMRARGPSLVFLVGLLAATSSLRALAADGRAPADAEVVQRLGFLHDRLEADRWHGQIWQRGWPALYTVGAVYSTAMGVEADVPARRADQLISAGLSVGGVVDLLVLSRTHAQEGADDLRGLPDDTPAQRRRKLARAEALLRRNAAESERRYDVLRHAMTVALPLASALFVGLYYDDWEHASVTLALSVAVGETTIWTQPWQATDDLAEYERRFQTPVPAARADDEPADDEPAEEQPAEEQPAEEQPAGDGPAESPTWRLVPTATGVWVIVGF